MHVFKVNDYLTLKLEDGITNIYIKGDDYPYLQCKYLLFNISEENREKYDEIKSIDEAADLLDKSMETLNAPSSEEDALTVYGIPPETEFWAHSSNLQVWAESGYDMRLLHSNLAFPLLKELAEAGDPLANRIFKEEVVKRFLEGPQKIREFFCNSKGYIDILTKEERRVLFKSDIEVVEELEGIMLKNLKHHGLRQLWFRVSRLESIYNAIMWKEGKVAGLNFDCSGLNEIPEPIRKLKDLEILILYAPPNEELPDWLSELKFLKHLVLQVGKLKKIPEWIGELKSLERLDVHHNEIENIPDSIGDLTFLRYLDLSENDISTVPESIGKLRKLKYLELSNNKLKLIPESIGDLMSLKKLSIWNNKLDSLPESIGNLRLLEELELVGNNLTSIPDSIYKLKCLKKLSLSHNPIRGLPQEILHLPLRIIYLNETKITRNWSLANALEKKGVELYFGKNK
ncbi:MAG: leucine-rich repeat domain-containing protein [Promethearchaeota archaeon]|nr:MAG: leucine-rich repeat domain-containing protein [Candidatus Lokiarchaeota archaeon]